MFWYIWRYLVEGNENNFVLEPTVYGWGKEIGQVNVDPESDTGFVQKEHWEKNFVCAQDFLRLIGTRLNLIATATATV